MKQIQKKENGRCRETCQIVLNCAKIIYHIFFQLVQTSELNLKSRDLSKIRRLANKMEKLKDSNNEIIFENLEEFVGMINALSRKMNTNLVQKKENLMNFDRVKNIFDAKNVALKSNLKRLPMEIPKLKKISKKKFYSIRFSRKLDELEIEDLISGLFLNGVVTTSYSPTEIDFEYTGNDANRLIRKHGFICKNLKKIDPPVEYSFRKRFELNENVSNETIISNADLFFQILEGGCIPFGEIKKYFLRTTNFKSMKILSTVLKKIKNKTNLAKRKNQLKVTKEKIELFDDENLFKFSIDLVNKNKKAMVYFAKDIVEYIKKNEFDHLFVDGTHFSNICQSQITIIRFYSSKTKRILTGFYILMDSQTKEDYSEVFKKIAPLGVFDKVNFLISDLERALISGASLHSKSMVNRLCFFHIVAACRRYKNSINKVIRNENLEKNSNQKLVTCHIFRLLCFLIFVPKYLQMTTFNLIKYLLRKFSNNNLGNELLLRYFESTYLTGFYKNYFYLDTQKSPIITNNFSEGLNSSIKRHAKGNLKMEHFLDWMMLDAKKNIVEIIQNKKNSHNLKINPVFGNFQRSFVSQKDWFSVFQEYAVSLGNFKKENKKMNKNQKDNSFELFCRHFYSFQFNIDFDNNFVLIDRNHLKIIISSDFYKPDNEIKYLEGIAQNWNLMCKKTANK